MSGLMTRLFRLSDTPSQLRSGAMFEDLEGRQLLSHGGGDVAGLIDAAPAAVTQQLSPRKTEQLVAKAAKNGLTTMLPLQITGISVQDGGLVASGVIGNTPFTVPLTLDAAPPAQGSSVPILELHLEPIHLDLLGLQVDTSAICLDISADPNGGLLGSLLAGVANLLNGGLDLGGLLGQLTQTQLTGLLNGLTDLLNGALGAITAPTSVVGVSSADNGGTDCDILNLALGPVDLNLLGLEVALDNCEDGPVTVDVTAEPGSGKLLGNLLCGVSRLLDGRASGVALANALTRLANAITGLLT